MTVFQAIILGVVQGITEFLPISSSGHLILLPEIFGWHQQSASFDVAVHLATLFAVIWVLWDDLVRMLRNVQRKRAWKKSTAVKILVATIPVVIAGLVVSGVFLERVRSPRVVVVNLAFWGVVLWMADIYSAKVKRKTSDTKKITWKQAIAIGCAQALALVPGTSRSGITMTAGLFTNLDRVTAAKFSFFLSIPAIAGAGLLVGIDAVQNGLDIPVVPLIAGFLAAFISGVIAIRFLLNILTVYSFKWFAMYRIALAVVLLLLVV